MSSSTLKAGLPQGQYHRKRTAHTRFLWPSLPWGETGEILQGDDGYAHLGLLPLDHHHAGIVIRSVSPNWRTVRRIRHIHGCDN